MVIGEAVMWLLWWVVVLVYTGIVVVAFYGLIRLLYRKYFASSHDNVLSVDVDNHTDDLVEKEVFPDDVYTHN